MTSWSVITRGVSLVSFKVALTPQVGTALFLPGRYLLVTVVSAITHLCHLRSCSLFTNGTSVPADHSGVSASHVIHLMPLLTAYSSHHFSSPYPWRWCKQSGQQGLEALFF